MKDVISILLFFSLFQGLHAQDAEINGNINIGASDAYKIGGVTMMRHFGDATIIGEDAGMNNTAVSNTFVGSFAGMANTTGDANTFLGLSAGIANDDGIDNVMVGHESGTGNVSGNGSVFVGIRAGISNVSGDSNTCIGSDANVSTGMLVNASAFGARAVVDASNKVRIGDGGVTVIEGQVAFSASSDRRLKKNINDTDIGLQFIQSLRPVNYNWKEGHEGKLYTGLIAQEVEDAATSLGYDFSAIVAPANEQGYYSLRYAEFVIPLINAVQELSDEKEALQSELAQLRSEMNSIKVMVAQIERSSKSSVSE